MGMVYNQALSDNLAAIVQTTINLADNLSNFLNFTDDYLNSFNSNFGQQGTALQTLGSSVGGSLASIANLQAIFTNFSGEILTVKNTAYSAATNISSIVAILGYMAAANTDGTFSGIPSSSSVPTISSTELMDLSNAVVAISDLKMESLLLNRKRTLVWTSPVFSSKVNANQ